MQPDDFSILYQDTDAGPWDAGASGSQTTFNNGRAVVAGAREDLREQLLDLAEEELEAARADLELVDGDGAGQGLADQERLDPRRWPRRPTATSCCSAGAPTRRRRCPRSTPPAAPAGWGWSRSSRRRSSPTRCAARSTARPASCRVLEVAASHDCGRILNPIGAERPGRGRRRDGHRDGAVGGHACSSEDGRQRNPHLLDYKLQTMSDAPPISIALRRDRHAQRRADGLEGHRRAALRADARRGRQRDRARSPAAASTGCR